MSDAKVLVLRTCDAAMRAHGGFVWPEAGPVEAPDWRDDTTCGGGLHGLLWGAGDDALVSWAEDARWLVVEVLAADIRDLGGKVKFPRGTVVHCGTRETATQYVAEHGGAGRAIVGVTLTGGYGSTLTGGDRSTLTGGYGSTLTGGDDSTLTGGDRSTLTGGDRSTLSIRWWDSRAERYRIAVGYVGEDGIEAGVAYRCDDAGKLVRA